MRLTMFWERMRAQFGDVYVQSVARDYVLTRLGGRTVDQALADGVEPQLIWDAVCEAFDVPERLRLSGHCCPGPCPRRRAVAWLIP